MDLRSIVEVFRFSFRGSDNDSSHVVISYRDFAYVDVNVNVNVNVDVCNVFVYTVTNELITHTRTRGWTPFSTEPNIVEDPAMLTLALPHY